MVDRRTGRTYVGAAPSKKAVGQAKDKVRSLLGTGNQAPTPEVVARVNRRLIGWANYFSVGTLHAAYRAVDTYTYHLLRDFLTRRHNVSGRGSRRFSWRHMYQSTGLVRLQDRRRVTTSHALA